MAKRGNNEGSIFKRADGRWAASLQVGYENGQRRRKSFYGRTQSEVQAQLVEARRAIQQGLLVDPPRLVGKKSSHSPLEQAQVLVKAAERDNLGALYILALTTGLRLGELLGLKWGADGEIHVRRQVTRSSAGMLFSEPKTTRGRRWVALPELALVALKGHRDGKTKHEIRLGRTGRNWT